MGDGINEILANFAWLEKEDVLACLRYAERVVGHAYVVEHEYYEPVPTAVEK